MPSAPPGGFIPPCLVRDEVGGAAVRASKLQLNYELETQFLLIELAGSPSGLWVGTRILNAIRGRPARPVVGRLFPCLF